MNDVGIGLVNGWVLELILVQFTDAYVRHSGSW